MDWTTFAEIMPDVGFSGWQKYQLTDGVVNTLAQDVEVNSKYQSHDFPDEVIAVSSYSALAFNDFSSSILMSVYNHEKGKFILNTLRIRENIGKDPVAERLLRNMLRYAMVRFVELGGC